MADDTFVNYSNPQDFADRRKRRQVASYIGIHFRNRSGPAAKRAKAKERKDLRLQSTRVSDEKISSAKPRPTVRSPLITIPNDGHGFRHDPFSSYPIEFESSIPSAVDYCKFLLPSWYDLGFCWLAHAVILGWDLLYRSTPVSAMGRLSYIPTKWQKWPFDE
jgi:hypothetical protein